MSDNKNVLAATDSNFDSDVLAQGTLSLVDFWAEWCGPCRQIAPTIEALADDYAGRVKVFKMNVDENPGTPGKFSIRGIPTIILFKDGQVVEQFVGAAYTKEKFAAVIDKHLS